MDDAPSRRSDDQPGWMFAVKAGVAILTMVGIGIAIGVMWGPVSTAVTSAASARSERSSIREDMGEMDREHERRMNQLGRQIAATEYQACVLRAYTDWIACRAVFETPANSCDQRYQEAQTACPRP